MDAVGAITGLVFVGLLIVCAVQDRRRRKALVRVVAYNQQLSAELAIERVRVQELRAQLDRLHGDPWEGARG